MEGLDSHDRNWLQFKEDGAVQVDRANRWVEGLVAPDAHIPLF